ncbi:MAG: hypothetical protein A2751_03770 [Candidatus Doudnabacteria bacterium RIFCSPHIGHO2_01_FULL_46_14]|uniref:Uncharacterized protein n=1 Tax=Candidatus Doudnabacteria bacterium RIFCSPHIGHO2_01_FULL_46_14 TaxID=1817824 RepID=A0A1F5NKS0_9BACT|nr:MAG: hypothetical protein A2751_03770 [Candidatus Doudnabacteria bacterium RIFCSPHIGHO2_01_FULL_46_14]
MKKKHLVFMLALVILWLLQKLTTDFHSLVLPLQILMIVSTMALLGLMVVICLFEKAKAIGGLIPWIMASALLVGPYSLSHGPIGGTMLALSISATGALLFSVIIKMGIKVPAVITSLADTAFAIAFISGISVCHRHNPEVHDGLHAMREMNRRQQRRPPQ